MRKDYSRVEVLSTPVRRRRKLLLSWKRMQRILTISSSLEGSATIRLISKPIEHNDSTPSPNFEFPVFEAEEDDVEEIPDEITRLLEHEKKIIQPYLENLETVNLGSEDCVREVKIGALLEESVKKGLIELLREYVDIFAWSYEDMPGLDTDIVQHFLPLKPECVLVKQKLRRTHPDMAVKIKEEVQKQIDAGFLVTSTYP
ncbi:hypothetical protein KIW84_043841 [Lathyrus oleraceus]|uniref:Uncharacterized protein n=1 Tax=Pisum sativum TaxID=3888 RepID=A0A9D4XIM3_PEA|nr:hypothetical protein KIW84_043841 [Pisum sativum]